jgi:hypothetical protein
LQKNNAILRAQIAKRRPKGSRIGWNKGWNKGWNIPPPALFLLKRD